MSVDKYLQDDPQNVVVVHCKGSSGNILINKINKIK